MDGKGLARALAEFVSGIDASEIPRPVIAEARIRLLDGLACAAAGTDNVTSGMASKWMERHAGSGRSTFWMNGHKGSVQDCAFANSVLVHSILHEDASVSGHPACNVVPAGLAVAEARNSSGTDLLAAIAIGYELQARMAVRGTAQRGMRAGGLRPTAMGGIFGAVGTAARLAGLSVEATESAIAFCASLCAPGIGEPLIVGSFERCLQMGQLTRSGVLAAELAESGFAGAATALDGDSGFYAAYLGTEAPTDAILAGLGTDWWSIESDGLYIYKPYPSAALNIGSIYCSTLLAQEEPIDVADVEGILVRQSWWDRNTGYVFGGSFKTIEQALMSGPFGVAVATLYGRYDWPTVQATFGTDAVDSLASRVMVQGLLGPGRRRYESASVTISLRGGRRRTTEVTALPQEMVTHTWSTVTEKFKRLTSHVLSAEAQEGIVEAVQSLESSPSVLDLVGGLAVVQA